MPSPSFDSLLEQADVLARAGQWQPTLDLLSQAAALEPQHAGVVTGQGTCLIKLGRPAEALDYFRRVATLVPASPEAHNNLGVTYALLQDVPAAEDAYKRALDCAPEHEPAWKNLAQLYIEAGRFDEGVPLLVQFIRAHRDDAEALTLMGSCYEEGGDDESAVLMYKEALKFQPDNELANAGLARLAPAPDLTHIARPEHAKKLAALKSLKVSKPGNNSAPKA
jgi:Flp pilus assembly protein TadD